MSIYSPQRGVQQALLLTGVLLAGAVASFGQEKLPVPDDGAQAEAVKLIRELYEQDYKGAKTPAEQTALANKLLEQAAVSKDDPTAHFVLLRVARDMAVQAGDANTALEAVDQIARTYQIDATLMRVETLLSAAANARLADARKAVAEAAIPLIRAAIGEDDYETANRLVRKAFELARRSRDSELLKQMVAVNREVADSGKAYAEVQQARAKLEEKPTDPEANLAVGRYLCVSKGDWEKGIPMLALGSDPALKALAGRELEEVDSPDAQVALADTWWDLAQKRTGPEKESFLLRAGYWYQEAEASLTSGLAKVKVRKRLEEIAKLGRPIPDSPSSRPRRSQPSSRRRAIEPWDVETVQHLGTLKGHTSVTYAVAFSPDGSTLASGNRDTTVKLWNIATGQCLQTFGPHERHSNHVYSVAFSPNGSTLAWAGATTPTVKLLNLATGELRQTPYADAGDIWAVAFSPDGSIVASGSDDKTIRLWDVQTGELRLTLEGHTGSVRSVAFVPNDATLVSGSEDRTVKLWDTASGRLRRTLAGHADIVFSVAVSPDGSILASGSRDGTVKLWRVATGEILRTLEGHTGHVRSVAFNPDGSLVASGSLDRTMKLWDVTTGEMKRSLEVARDNAVAIAFSPNGSVLASSGSGERSVMLWGPAPDKRR